MRDKSLTAHNTGLSDGVNEKMMPAMSKRRHELKVLDPVVGPVFVFVVYILGPKQCAADVL
jgi:hypothetical protein